MHILHVTDSLGRGGAERALVEIANHTTAPDYRVSVCVTRTGLDLAEDLRDDIPVWVLNRQSRFDWPPMWRFARLVRENDVDLLHTHGRTSCALVSFMRTIGLVDRPVIMHDHYGNIEFDERVPWWFRWWARRHLFHYVGVYPKLRTWALRAGVPPERISVIDYGLSMDRITQAAPVDVRAEFGIGADKLVGMAIGNLRPAKGTDTLLQAIAGCTQRDRVVILVVGGDRDTRYANRVRAMKDEMGLGDTVIFTGERTDVPGMLHGVDFGLMPSRSESGPLVLLEFMIAELPFVSTLTGNLAHRINELDVPEFVSIEDPAALAAGLDRLLALSDGDRQARAAFGQAIMRDHFEIQQMMPRWYALYAAAEGMRA